MSFSWAWVLVFEALILAARCQHERSPLYLTPLIKSGMIAEAQNRSEVKNIFPGIKSYSGLITVNEQFNSNLFFWFFPAANNAANASVVLWSEGGPGITGLHSLLNHNGPFVVEGGKLGARNNSWHLRHNIIYLDNPVGVGFSFTENEEGHVNSGHGAAPDIYEFLQQFFQLFPHLRQNDFYNGGVSYGATYASVVASYIHAKNQENSTDSKINLKGLLLESPWIDSTFQVDYGSYLLNLGLISDTAKAEFDAKFAEIQRLVGLEQYEEAFGIWSALAISDVIEETGYPAMYNILNDELTNPDHTDIVSSDPFRQEIHVGNLTFSWISQPVQSNMNKNFMASAKPQLETILDSGYSTLIYTGNLDMITGHLGVKNLVSNLNWLGKDEFSNATRKIWRVEERVAGYAKAAKNLAFLVMRNAGHGANGDQPEWGFELFNKFMEGMPFSQ